MELRGFDTHNELHEASCKKPRCRLAENLQCRGTRSWTKTLTTSILLWRLRGLIAGAKKRECNRCSRKAFVAELKAQGLFDAVTMVSSSDFGRTLTSNGKAKPPCVHLVGTSVLKVEVIRSDISRAALAGNRPRMGRQPFRSGRPWPFRSLCLPGLTVSGGAVRGGKVFNDYPESLLEGNNQDCRNLWYHCLQTNSSRTKELACAFFRNGPARMLVVGGSFPNIPGRASSFRFRNGWVLVQQIIARFSRILLTLIHHIYFPRARCLTDLRGADVPSGVSRFPVPSSRMGTWLACCGSSAQKRGPFGCTS